jgi:hypothetical protein
MHHSVSGIPRGGGCEAEGCIMVTGNGSGGADILAQGLPAGYCAKLVKPE